MTISETKDEEPAPIKSNECAGRTTNNSFSYATNNEFFTSTPYYGFSHTHLPPITSIYSPFARFYGAAESSAIFTMDPSSSSSSFDSSLESRRADQYSPPPRLIPFNTTSVYNLDTPYARKPPNSSLQSDSGFFSSTASSLGTPISRNAVRGYKKTYCSICKMHINKDGKRSQGPRRHLLQYHVRRPLFQCPHCSHSSFYDKFHVTSHMRRIHQDDSERLINRSSEFEDEVEEWYERCFGERRSSTRDEMRQSLQKPLSPAPAGFSPPPVLTPEVPDKENVDPCGGDPVLEVDNTPLKAPVKRRKMGFMMDDILQASPPKRLSLPRGEGINL